MRFFFLGSGSIIWLGIWLTGFSTVHWVLYLPGAFFYFAALAGICPGLIFSRMLFPAVENLATNAPNGGAESKRAATTPNPSPPPPSWPYDPVRSTSA